MAGPPEADGDPRVEAASRRVADAVRTGAFPCAVAEYGRTRGVVWREAFGTLDHADGSVPAAVDTIFDLASLTKVVATTSLAMQLEEAGALSAQDLVGRWLPAWRGEDRAGVEVADLLAHCSGLAGHLHLYRDLSGLDEFVETIVRLPLDYPPRSAAVYSDLGFILLGAILERAATAPLHELFAGFVARVTTEPLRFLPPGAWRARTAPTGVDTWRGRLLVGEVHDRNAWALGGRAGHAGLFGTAAALGDFARAVLGGLAGSDDRLARPETIRRYATRRRGVPGSTRALGWDTMTPTSSCGACMSARAIGHTGFTGTSLWIDPEQDVYAVLLTNRVHPTGGANEAILGVRRAFHDALLATNAA